MQIVRPALVALMLTATLGACAAPPPGGGPNDPYEAVNRQIHGFNKGVDRVALRPASQAYGVLPRPVRTGVSNFASNASQPGYVLNDVLQGQIEDAGHNAFRFAVNTTLGVLGIFNPAASFGLEARETDFGQTLDVWGTREGAYVALPLLGPSTERDAVGKVVDTVTNPVRALVPPESQAVLRAGTIGDTLNTRHTFGTTIDQILYDSADSYAQTRDIYLQNRRFELGSGDADDYFDPYEDVLE